MNKALFLFLFLSGCMIGPNHNPPNVAFPCHYEEAPCDTEPLDLSLWWKQFDDPMLDDLIEEALTCNYDLQIALHKIEEFRALYKIDLSLLYPQIQANMVAIRARRSENLGSDIIEATGTPADIVATDFSGPLIQWFYQTGLDASWEIDLWGKNRRRAEASRYDFEATQESALNIQITLLSDVATSYIDIRSLEQRIEAKQEQIEQQQELLELAESRYAAGLTSYRDVTGAKAELESVQATLPPLQENLKQTIHGLAVLLGRPPEDFCLCSGDLPSALGRIPPNLPSDLLQQRPDIREANRELGAATSRIGVAIGDLLPTFSLTGSFGTQTNMLDKLFIWPSRFWTIGPNMIWNLFTGGRLLAQIKVANERQKQAILSYENVINTALADVENRLVGYFKEEERLHRLEEQLTSTSLTRDLFLEQYLAGLISLDDVLNVQRDLFLAQENMIESRGTQMVQLVGFYKALGGGWQCSDLP